MSPRARLHQIAFRARVLSCRSSAKDVLLWPYIIITNTIGGGDPYYNYSIMRPKALLYNY